MGITLSKCFYKSVSNLIHDFNNCRWKKRAGSRHVRTWERFSRALSFLLTNRNNLVIKTHSLDPENQRHFSKNSPMKFVLKVHCENENYGRLVFFVPFLTLHLVGEDIWQRTLRIASETLFMSLVESFYGHYRTDWSNAASDLLRRREWIRWDSGISTWRRRV